MAAVVVADASVLIALDQIGQLSLLQKLFGVLLVPPAVTREVAPSLHQLPSWVQTRSLERPPDARVKSSLDPGETEAICLALEVKADRIILDDLRRDPRGCRRERGRGVTSPQTHRLGATLGGEDLHQVPIEKSAGGVTTTYTYDRLNLLREVRGAGTLKYVHGTGGCPIGTWPRTTRPVAKDRSWNADVDADRWHLRVPG